MGNLVSSSGADLTGRKDKDGTFRDPGPSPTSNAGVQIVTDEVPHLLGRPARSFADWVAGTAGVFRT